MHSLEVIIALLFLFSFFGIILASILIQENNFSDFEDKSKNYAKTLFCVTTIDFIFANSLEKANITNCFGEKDYVFVKNSSKKLKILTNLKNDSSLGVEINEHYLD